VGVVWKINSCKIICQAWQWTIIIDDNYFIENIFMTEYAGSVSLVAQESRLYK
jgi:hypothetical protein